MKVLTVYLASPYSHKYVKVMRKREKEITRIAGELTHKFKQKKVIVSFFLPITQSAAMTRFVPELGSGDFSNWAAIDLHEVSLRQETWIVMMEGWDISVGVRAEINEAKRLGKSIKYINPQNLKFVKAPDEVVHV